MAPGTNSITRRSSQASTTVPDVPSFLELIEAADEAVETGDGMYMEEFERSCGIPNRLLLPKGREEGMEFVLAVGVTDAEEDDDHEVLESGASASHAQCGVRGQKYPDHQPMGFPLDRRIPDERIFLNCKNVQYNVVTITHIGNK